MSMDSATLRRRLEGNPLNMPNVPGFPPMSLHNYWAARFEAQGRADYEDKPCPYNSGTMADQRWWNGWKQADAAARGIAA